MSGLFIFVRLLEHEWASNLELERFSEVKHKGQSKLGVKRCYKNLNFFQRFLHISSVLLCQYASVMIITFCCGRCWMLCSLKQVWFTPPTPFVSLIVGTWTGLLLCKHGTSLVGCPCWSHAHLKPCELRILIFFCRPSGFVFDACGHVDHIGWILGAHLLSVWGIELAVPFSAIAINVQYSHVLYSWCDWIRIKLLYVNLRS